MMLIKLKINISFLANPFYIYCFAFFSALLTYLWGWSDIYPKLSSNLVLFLVLSFVPFIIAGYFFEKRIKSKCNRSMKVSVLLIDIMFILIIILGLFNILLTGYIPILDRSHDYREFGAPVIDVLFNTLSIFFSVVFLYSFLNSKKKRFLLYMFLILIIQIILFRRSTMIWIITSSLFLLILYYKKITLGSVILMLTLLPLVAFAFGYMGIKRNNLTHTQIIDDLGASQSFRNSGFSQEFYLTYLYISSPLANLQENISPQDKFLNKNEIKDFFLYSILPQSFTIRLEKRLNFVQPEFRLITPQLIVGSCYMLSYCTMGWAGMMLMLIFIIVLSVLSLFLSDRWHTFFLPAIAILTTSTSILIFDNVLNRLDVILMLFIYPALFHFINLIILKKRTFTDAVI